jgi:hypothetical protein
MYKIKIEHIGESDKPFPIIELVAHSGETNSNTESKIIISDSSIFFNVIKYFEGSYVGKSDYGLSDFQYGTFLITFYSKEGDEKKIILNKEGAIYFYVNLHGFIPDNDKNRDIISGIIRRLL